jgi:hypothetical protein
MNIDAAKNYLTSTLKTPFFLFVSDGQYSSAIEVLKEYGLDFVGMSRFCNDNDKIPDIDSLFSYIEEADVNAVGKKFVVTGLGEFLALRGIDEATRTISRLKDLNIGGAKVILLLRGLALLTDRLKTDPRFDNRRHSIIDRAECDLSFTVAPPSVGLSALTGFQAMLIELENGRNGSIVVSTAVNLNNAVFTVH